MKRKKTMSRRARDELVSGIALRYAKADRKGKGIILDEVAEDTGYNRKYLIHKLNRMAFCTTHRDIGGREHKVAYRRRPSSQEGRRGRPRRYDEALRASLVAIWSMFDMMCSRRLMKLIRDNITSIASYPPFHITAEMKGKLLEMSPATADRLLRPERERMRFKGRSGTRSPGSSLNALIPVRAYYSFDERKEAGSFEIDTVVHCGYGPQDGALWTLTLTDVSNGFVYIRVLRAKTQRYVMQALDDIAGNAPYPIRELHMDNGSEFKNIGFIQWCTRHGVAFTRSRSYHKNDNCFVEAKNFTAVRSYVGYYRYQGDEAYHAMEDLYWHLERLLNLYYPSVKLLSKERIGIRTVKEYDEPRSPYERILMDGSVPDGCKASLMQEKRTCRLIPLKQSVDLRQDELLALAVREGDAQRRRHLPGS